MSLSKKNVLPENRTPGKDGLLKEGGLDWYRSEQILDIIYIININDKTFRFIFGKNSLIVFRNLSVFFYYKNLNQISQCIF